MNLLYDIIIIGSGPAGLTAGIYAKRALMETVIIEKNPISGGQIINTYEVDNYPGIPGVSGFELANRFREHAKNLGVSFVQGEVVEVKLEEKEKQIIMSNGDIYKTKTIIIASGAGYRKLAVPGETEFTGKGVSYCATCDGAFFRNKVTVVVGGGDVAVEDAIFLARVCKKVFVIHRRGEFRAAKSLVSKLMSLENVEIIWNSVVEKIEGEENVTGVVYKTSDSETSNHILVDGVFIAVGTVPNSEIYRNKVEMDELGYILADETCKTNIPGVFVAGDIRKKQLKQVITAAADGANAITAVERYLNQE